MALGLTAAGVVFLTLFALAVWPPLALLVIGAALLVAGLLVDWESLSGKPDSPRARR